MIKRTEWIKEGIKRDAMIEWLYDLPCLQVAEEDEHFMRFVYTDFNRNLCVVKLYYDDYIFIRNGKKGDHYWIGTPLYAAYFDYYRGEKCLCVDRNVLLLPSRDLIYKERCYED